MKAKDWVIVRVVLIVCLTVIVSTYAFEMKEAQNTFSNRKRVVFISPVANQGYWAQIANGITDAADANGLHAKFIGARESDASQQLSAIYDAISSRTDAIITVGIDNAEYETAFEKARDQGITVVLVDTDSDAGARNCYIGTDNFKAGGLAAEKIKEMDIQGSILLTGTERSNKTQAERRQGFITGIDGENLKCFTVQCSSKSVIHAREDLYNALIDRPETGAVFCMEGYTSRAFCQLKEEYPEKFGKIKGIVFDLNSETYEALGLKNIDGIVSQSPREMGRLAVQEVIAGFKKGNVSKKVLLTPELVEFSTDNMQGATEQEKVEWHIY